MADDAPSFVDADPHLVRATAEETDGAFVRFESTLHPALDADDPGVDLAHERWGLDNDFEHVHPEQEERWEVVAGELRVAYADETRTLRAGESVTLPSRVPHRHWNPSAEPARVVWERRPAFRDEEWAESVYALAQAGETDENGVPDALQIAVWMDAYPHATAYPAVVPVGVQRVLAALVAPLGRFAGYEATHARPDGTDD
ncbi:cupin domain-containing protein [Halarchaeum sp. P4]|uniref:cupin domain-containing protein n=1 Tax=Halarchaeum sp. P4 TaxID=3421639 RepID=UPI003EBC09A5